MRYYRKIVGDRLYLSPGSAQDDAEQYLEWMNTRAVAGDFGQYHHVVASKADLNWLYEPPSHMQRYSMVLLEGDVLIGSVSIHNIDHLNRNAFVGILIGEAEHRGRGYGAEALSLLLEYGFKTLNLRGLMLTVHADNAAAIACYKNVGFREVGRLPQWVYKDGRYVDKLYMCRSAPDFIK